ncbi:MAG: hypothetical protein JNK04_04365 [Myxococcales bacterium]|nr:hypothetical protein [Myxococcales bacterium]
MKLGVFNLWTEMRDLPPSDAFEVSPIFGGSDLRTGAKPALDPTLDPQKKRAPKKRKPAAIVDEITAS